MIGRRLGLVWAVAVAVAVGIGIGAATVGDPPTRCPMPGVANGFQLGPGFWSGGEPEGDEAFEALAALGVKTIVSVDGSPPDLKSAHRHGIRYIHVPIKYDGVTRDQAALLVAASRSSDGPIFVHCHHGKHRGPTAAAIMMMGNGDWDSGSATDWLREAGTDPLYRGLFAAVKDFRPLRPEELAEVDPEDLPEVAEVPDLVTSMVEIDERFDRLGRLADAKPVDPDPSGAEPEPRPRGTHARGGIPRGRPGLPPSRSRIARSTADSPTPNRPPAVWWIC